MNLSLNRFHIMLAGILLLIIGLFIPNSIVGILICVTLAAAAFYDERIGIYFLIITIPIRPFIILYNTGYKFIGDILILFLLLKIAYNNRKKITSLFRLSFLEISFLLFIAVGVVSAFLTGVSLPAIIMQVRAFLLFFLLFYIVKRMTISQKDTYDFALVTFVTATILSIQGIIEKVSVRTLLLPEIWENMELAVTNKTRVYGLIGGPNELALYLAISFIISFYLLMNATGRFRILIYTGMTLILAVFFLTYSRGAVLGVAAFLIMYLLINRKLANFKSLMVILISSAVLFLGVVTTTNYVEKYLEQQSIEDAKNPDKNKEKTPEKGLNRFTGAFSDENMALSNEDGRVYYVKKAIEVFKDRPINGYGFGTFGGAATQTYSSPIYKQYKIAWNFYSDNQYIQILAETGLAGTIFILLSVLGMGKMTWSLRKGYIFSALLIFFFVTAIVSGVVYNILENDVFTMYYFILLGFAHHFLAGKKGKDSTL
ncbi:O-antigen ligase family protein [Bacillus marasmi]|uniref:O-antigen ligase family protein n=1 Tax=Bacillus marasmi TaxID=1926279 RepID=UPI0011CB5929|nr:O-antigen ligase family protein [Bacillus marasmi]